MPGGILFRSTNQEAERMSRSTSNQLRTLERIEQATREFLERTPPVVASAALPPSTLPPSLETAGTQMAQLADAVGRARLSAAGLESLLQSEAEALAGWVETLIRIKTGLTAWTEAG